ncbi:MAG: EAL domain-containing protein, partial [Woeseia sp.]
QQAQIALEVAKESGKDLVTADDDSVRYLKDGWEMRDELAHAVRDSDLELHYQPKIDLQTNEICGVEALMRWFSPTWGQVPPARFFAVAEGTDLLAPMTRYALNAALRCAVLWRRDGNDIGIAVNLPASLLLDAELVDMIRSLLSIWNIPASLLTLEITESSIMTDVEASFATMNRLKELGARISIDDFGTGFSSFSYFQSIPADELKIDRTFVTGMVTNPADRHLVETMLNLAHRFGMTVVAEGIEDEATLTALRDAGCDVGQGFHIARPMPQVKFDAWLDARIMEQLVAQQDDHP